MIRRWCLPPVLLAMGCNVLLPLSARHGDDLGKADVPAVADGPDAARDLGSAPEATPADLPDLSPHDQPLPLETAPDLPQPDSSGPDAPSPDLPQPDQQPPVPDQTMTPDQPDPDAGIDPLVPFGTAVAAGVGIGDEDDPTLTGDMLEICFERQDDVYCATRSGLGASWSAEVAQYALNTSSVESAPELSPNGLTVFFSSDRTIAGAKGGKDIFVAKRTSRAMPWGPAQHVPELSSSVDDTTVSFTPDLLTIFVTADGASGKKDLFHASRTGTTATWGPLQLLSTVNTVDTESGPWTSADLGALYFASDRNGGKDDLFVALLQGFDGNGLPNYSAATPVAGGVNLSTTIEKDPWLSPNQRTIYFVRIEKGVSTIFTAWR